MYRAPRWRGPESYACTAGLVPLYGQGLPAMTGSQTPSVEDARMMKTAPMRSFWAKSGLVHPSSAPPPQGSAEGDGAAAPDPTTLLTRDICKRHDSITESALKALAKPPVPQWAPKRHAEKDMHIQLSASRVCGSLIRTLTSWALCVSTVSHTILPIVTASAGAHGMFAVSEL